MFSIYHHITLDRDGVILIRKSEESIRDAIIQNKLSIDTIINLDKTLSQKAAIPEYRAVGKIRLNLEFDFDSFPLITDKIICENDIREIGKTIFPRCDFSISARYSFVHEIKASMLTDQKYNCEHKNIVQKYIECYAGSLAVGRYMVVAEQYHIHASRIATECAKEIGFDYYGNQYQAGAVKAISRFAGTLAADLVLFHQFCSPEKSPRNASSARSGVDFEIIIRDILQSKGFSAHLTSQTGDFGGDIIAERDGIRYCIQCKNTNSPSGVKSVQEVSSACAYYECDYAVVVSSGGYTERAHQMARKLGVLLHDEASVAKLGSVGA